ncbi:hypothetical protein BD413DRAFT_649630 [Trametes elegans]|nr:hypothetical protein BD413DRAFT_649630 [Trametes elegans]
MGSSSSKAPSAQYGSGSISYPAPLHGDPGKKTGGAFVNRRATTTAAPAPPPTLQGSLGVPSSSQVHRRSRSALVGSARADRPVSAQYQAPPPPYAEAVADAGSPSPGPGARAFLAVPGQQQQRSRSQDAPRTSNNPFLQRPVSSIGLPASGGATAGVEASSQQGGGTLGETFEERAEYLRRPMRQNTIEDALETLRKYNTVIVVDDSGSMSKGGLWTEAREALAALADVAAKYDADGIDVCFLNSKKTGANMTNGQQVRRMFDSVLPRGATPIGERLEDLMLYYLNELDNAKSTGGMAAVKTIKPVNYIILTDGVPTDDPASVIANVARRLDEGNYPLSQVGIQFVQIGSHRSATEYLRTLDDELQAEYHVRDIVDTTPYIGGRLSADTIIKILLGGINRRVDKRGGQSVM